MIKIILSKRLFLNQSLIFTGKNTRCFEISCKNNVNLLLKRNCSQNRRLASLKPSEYFLLIIPVSTFCLGTWQVYRWRWKLGLIKEMEGKLTNEFVDFPFNSLEDLENLEYKKVKLKGYYDFSKEILLGPRSLLESKESQSSGLISGGKKGPNCQSGYLVITPFVVENQNIRILVNRGWIPAKDRNLEKYAFPKNSIEITGIIRKNEKRLPFMGKNSCPRSLWLYRDIPQISRILNTSEAFIDLSSNNSENLPDNIPIAGQTRVTLRNDHVSYFFTWYSLSIITSYMWHRRFLRSLPLL